MSLVSMPFSAALHLSMRFFGFVSSIVIGEIFKNKVGPSVGVSLSLPLFDLDVLLTWGEVDLLHMATSADDSKRVMSIWRDVVMTMDATVDAIVDAFARVLVCDSESASTWSPLDSAFEFGVDTIVPPNPTPASAFDPWLHHRPRLLLLHRRVQTTTGIVASMRLAQNILCMFCAMATAVSVLTSSALAPTVIALIVGLVVQFQIWQLPFWKRIDNIQPCLAGRWAIVTTRRQILSGFCISGNLMNSAATREKWRMPNHPIISFCMLCGRNGGSRIRWFCCYFGLGRDIVGFNDDVRVVAVFYGTNIHRRSNYRLCGNHSFVSIEVDETAKVLTSEVEVAVVLMGWFAIILWNFE